jgi:DNA-directed RNA polymerase subunit RPC12/RpoP
MYDYAKIDRLTELFEKRSEINKEIMELLGPSVLVDEKTSATTLDGVRIGRQRKKNVGTHTSPGLKKPKKPKQYRCSECEDDFESDLPKIDVACPECKSVHIVKR